METPEKQSPKISRGPRDDSCGRPGCMCGLPIGERFVLWALRQWHQERALPTEGSPLHRGFGHAQLLEVLPDFTLAMDAYLFGARRALEIHSPACSCVSDDEATVVALCGLAQSGHDRLLAASLQKLMVPTASRVAGERLKCFALGLARSGLQIAASQGEPGARLN